MRDIIQRQKRIEIAERKKETECDQDEKKEEAVYEDAGGKESTQELAFVAALHENRIAKHFERVTNYRKYFVAANDLFEQAAVGPSGLRKSVANNSAGNWKSMKHANAIWTAEIAARAGNINREILGEDPDDDAAGSKVTSLRIRRQLRHARYLERKEARPTVNIVSMHTNSPVPVQGIGHTRGINGTPHRFPRPPSSDSKSNFYSAKVANAKKAKPIPNIISSPGSSVNHINSSAKKMTVEDYFREARKYRAQLNANANRASSNNGNFASLPPSPERKHSARNAGSNVKMLRPKTAATVDIIKMDMMKEDEMISGKGLNLHDHDADPSTLFGSFVNYRYKERELEEIQKKANEEKILEAKRARKKKIKSRHSKSTGKLGKKASVKKTTIKLNTKGVRKRLF